MGAKAKSKRSRPPAAPVATAKLARFARTPAAYVLVSLAVLIPCFWQPRIQAGDLGSHIYNAWLAQLVAKGQAPGLAIVGQTTNVVFDLLLSGLFGAVGADAAQRIAVSIAVLVFFWGAFAFVASVSQRPWRVAAVLAALAYGWVFHMGFFNFYLGLGFGFWALAIAWCGSPRRLLAAVPLLAIAYVCHALAFVWVIGALMAVNLCRRIPPRGRWYLIGAALIGLFVLRTVVVHRWLNGWFGYQAWHVTGADQLWVFTDRYALLGWLLAAVWVWLGSGLWRIRGAAPSAAADLLPIVIITSAGILLIPTAIWVPGYQHQLAFIAERMSLPLAVAVCALLSTGSVSKWQAGSMALIAALFFGFLYTDEAKLNVIEDRVDEVVGRLPPGQRVVFSVLADGMQVNALAHMVDRACVGRCSSYANYEPSTGQFRLRVTGDTDLAARTNPDAVAFDTGNYDVKPRDLPLFQIRIQGGRLVLRQVPAGQPIGVTLWSGL